jgi:hypothetical protein
VLRPIACVALFHTRSPGRQPGGLLGLLLRLARSRGRPRFDPAPAPALSSCSALAAGQYGEILGWLRAGDEDYRQVASDPDRACLM